jgi:hypothetical protein
MFPSYSSIIPEIEEEVQDLTSNAKRGACLDEQQIPC